VRSLAFGLRLEIRPTGSLKLDASAGANTRWRTPSAAETGAAWATCARARTELRPRIRGWPKGCRRRRRHRESERRRDAMLSSPRSLPRIRDTREPPVRIIRLGISGWRYVDRSRSGLREDSALPVGVLHPLQRYEIGGGARVHPEVVALAGFFCGFVGGRNHSMQLAIDLF